MSTKIYNETKESLVADIKSRLEDGIIEKSNADLIIKLINNAEDLNEAISIAALGTTYRRTGFHFDKRLEKLGNKIKYFKKNEKLSFNGDDGKPTNTLIIGDNFDALQNLLIQYRGKIDVIYIDPPYGKDSMGEFAKTNYDNAITRDNLLSMLYNRLVLARDLLTDEGVIFCSMDDRNQAYVKCLFDDIFGEYNFIANLVWKNEEGGGASDSGNFKIKHEYILCYANVKESLKEIKNVEIEDYARYKLSDEFEKERGKYQLIKLASASLQYSKKMDYELEAPDGTKLFPIDNTEEGKDFAIWRWSKNKYDWGVKNKFIVWEKGKDNKWSVYTKQYTNCDKDGNIIERTKRPIGVINNYSTTQASNMLFDIIGKKVFDFAKPVELIKYLLDRYLSKNNGKVLDFFAGSGTTGQAVLELNSEDNGSRQYILVQLNEDLDKALLKANTDKQKQIIKNQISLCDEMNRPHNLSEITAERLRRVMIGTTLNGKSDYKWLEKNKPYGGSLVVYDIEDVDNYERKVGKSPFEVIDETLYGCEKFVNIKDKIKWVCENFEHTQNEIDNDDSYIEMIEKNKKNMKGEK